MTEHLRLAFVLCLVHIAHPRPEVSIYADSDLKWPTYRHPDNTEQLCYKCPPTYYFVRPCRIDRNNNPGYSVCKRCTEPEFSSTWNVKERCWEKQQCAVGEKLLYDGGASGPALCECDQRKARFTDGGQCVEAVTKSDYDAALSAKKECEERECPPCTTHLPRILRDTPEKSEVACAPCTATPVSTTISAMFSEGKTARTEVLPCHRLWIGIIIVSTILAVLIGICICVARKWDRKRSNAKAAKNLKHSASKGNGHVPMRDGNTAESQRSNRNDDVPVTDEVSSEDSKPEVTTNGIMVDSTRNVKGPTHGVSGFVTNNNISDSGDTSSNTDNETLATKSNLQVELDQEGQAKNTAEPIDDCTGQTGGDWLSGSTRLHNPSTKESERKLRAAFKVIENSYIRSFGEFTRNVLELDFEDIQKLDKSHGEALQLWKERKGKVASVEYLLASLRKYEYNDIVAKIEDHLKKWFELDEVFWYQLSAVGDTSEKHETLELFIKHLSHINFEVLKSLVREEGETRKLEAIESTKRDQQTIAEGGEKVDKAEPIFDQQTTCESASQPTASSEVPPRPQTQNSEHRGRASNRPDIELATTAHEDASTSQDATGARAGSYRSQTTSDSTANAVRNEPQDQDCSDDDREICDIDCESGVGHDDLYEKQTTEKSRLSSENEGKDAPQKKMKHKRKGEQKQHPSRKQAQKSAKDKEGEIASSDNEFHFDIKEKDLR